MNDRTTRKEYELARLKRQIRDNEQVWAGFQGIAIDAIAAGSLQDLSDRVVTGIERTFANVDCACIACLNLDYEIERLLSMERPSPATEGRIITLSPEALAGLFPGDQIPRLHECNDRLQALLFPTFHRRLGSVALSPLVVNDKLIGCLAQASVDPRHFTPHVGTELLRHLSAIIALCIQNLVNRARLERDGLTDPLTEISNRRFLERRLQEEIDRCQRHHHDLACLMIDIDHFKKINDEHGHGVGDRVLRDTAQALLAGLRSSDVLSRYGGEEFVILLPEANRDQGCLLAERQRAGVAARDFQLDDGRSLKVTVSIGVASYETISALSEPINPEQLIGSADKALYLAKQNGRDQVAIIGDDG